MNKTSEIAVEAIKNLDHFTERVLQTENAGEDYRHKIEFLVYRLKAEVFDNMVKHEYPAFYAKTKQVSEKRFIKNPKKTLGRLKRN